MAWMNQLLKTYENSIGKLQDINVQMTPVAHMNANAQIQVSLSAKGEFLGAISVEKEDAVTLIPVTEESAGRSSGIAPHALCDTLSYIAGDYAGYCEGEKQKKVAEAKFEAYIGKLKEWMESQHTNPKVAAIYQYLSQKVLIQDLIATGHVVLKDNGTFDNGKISGSSYEKSIVRFQIFDPQNQPAETWNDVALIQDYTSYYLSKQSEKKDVCYLTGLESTISENHPKGIIAASYGAKLVSANDSQGYTFRGRFQNAEQSYALSYEASQKIHSALTWLAKVQGTYIGRQDKRMYICWNPKGKKVPKVFEEFDFEEENDGGIDTTGKYKQQLRKTFQGYQNQFDESDEVIVIGLDAATTGRLSVTYYNELPASDFMDRIIYWGETCKWFYFKFKDKKPCYEMEVPLFQRIVECAFGRETGNFIEVDDRILKEQTQRLVKCMLERQTIPYDIVHALMLRASTPLAYSSGNRERVLSTACAIISKYYHDKGVEGEDIAMKLNTEEQDRSYLFGRLLAIYEKVERATYDKDERREPNAIRLQAAYINHPLQTCMTLDALMKPYFEKLAPGLREYYRRLISEIFHMIKLDQEQEMYQELNRGLNEMYLLGYYLQRAELNKKKDESKED